MAASYMLSQHSSNPLEVHSSDARNSLYVSKYRKATNARSEGSSDRIGGCDAPELDEYQQHIATLRHGDTTISASTSRQTRLRVPRGFVDLDEDMSSDEDGAADNMHEDIEGHEMDNEGGTEDAELEDDTLDVVTEDLEEEKSILLKPEHEQDEIRDEIEDLERAVPQLAFDYKIVDRLGTGTFSAVYKAVDLGYHAKWDNHVWQGSHPPSSSAYYQTMKQDKSKGVFVAIKRIYVTSGPERIKNEIAILEDCRNCRHVSQLITAFREKDQVVAIMPYHRNEDFRVRIYIEVLMLINTETQHA